MTINGEKAGLISNGTTLDFAFTPKPDANTLEVSMASYSPGTVTFKVSPGQVFNATCEIGWVSITVKGENGKTLDTDLPLPNMELVKTSVDPGIKKVEVDSEVVTPPRGVKRTVKKARTITRTIETATTTKAGADVEVSIGPLTAKVQGEIEKKVGRTFQESDTVEQTVELDGNVHQRFQLTWYDRYRTGEISYREAGTLKTAKFRFREGTELDVSEVK